MTTDSEDDWIALDVASQTLTREYGQLVMQHLRNTSDDVTTLEELTEFVVAGHSDPQDPEKVKIHLHHATLPKLDGANLLEYDPRSGEVRYHPDFVAEDLLDRVHDRDA